MIDTRNVGQLQRMYVRATNEKTVKNGSSLVGCLYGPYIYLKIENNLIILKSNKLVLTVEHFQTHNILLNQMFFSE